MNTAKFAAVGLLLAVSAFGTVTTAIEAVNPQQAPSTATGTDAAAAGPANVQGRR